MNHRMLPFLLVLPLVVASAATEPTSPVKLIVNGDDVGITRAFTDAVLEAYFDGKLSSVSVFAPGVDAERALEILAAKPGFPAGVHLTLNGDVPPLTEGKTLRNANGTMWDTPEQVRNQVDALEAEREWQAQVNRVIDAGVAISHLDGHMGCYFQTPDLMAAAMRVAEQFQLPLITPFVSALMDPALRDTIVIASYTGIYRLPGQGQEAEGYGERAEAYWNLFRGLEPGIHYLYTHPGVQIEGADASADMDLRVNEDRFWRDAQTHERLAAMGIEVVGPEQLRRTPEATPAQVTLPPALARVLRDYEQAWARRDAKALSQLFTEDGFVLSSKRPAVRGRMAIETHYEGAGGDLFLNPKAFEISEELAYIVGGYRFQKHGSEHGKFVLALRRDPGGRWWIAADMDNANQ